MKIATKIKRVEDFNYLMGIAMRKELKICTDYFNDQSWDVFPYFTYDDEPDVFSHIYGSGTLETNAEERSLGRMVDELNNIVVTKTFRLDNQVELKAFGNGQIVQIIIDHYPHQITIEK